MEERITADDFFTGLMAALAVRNKNRFSLRGQVFYQAIETAYKRLRVLAPTYEAKVPFRIILDPIHRDSAQIRETLTRAAQRNLVSLDNPEFQDVRLKISAEEAQTVLAHLPGSPDLYSELAQEFENSSSVAM